MKIRVTLICLMCSIAAGSRNTTTAQLTSSSRKFPDRKDMLKKFEPKHRVYEYSRSMEAVHVDLKNEDSGSQSQITNPTYYSEAVVGEKFPNGLSGGFGEGSERSLQLATMRINSKRPSEMFKVGPSPLGEKVLSRKKKDQMEQAVLALLMAYKMKFTALVPILLGGISLLISTTALAGFFFALFAAVLGLKAH